MLELSIELLVNDVIEKYDLQYPLDIKKFIDILGFDIKYVDTGSSDAYTIIINGKKVILLNKDIHSEKRINFTLAHELGHYFIPNHLEPLYECNVNELVSTVNLNDKKVEKEADLFASELLLPSKLIKRNSTVNSLKDILNVAETYGTSIPVAAIKIIKNTDDVVCFICCQNQKIKWFISSSEFREYIVLKDIIGSPVPELSSLYTCMETGQQSLKDKVPAFIWVDEVDHDVFIDEEILYYSRYDTGYILIRAESLINYEDELLL